MMNMWVKFLWHILVYITTSNSCILHIIENLQCSNICKYILNIQEFLVILILLNMSWINLLYEHFSIQFN